MKLTTSVSSRLSPRGWRLAALLAWSAIAAGTGLGAGCGQKGPLTLPGAAVATSAATSAAKPAAAAASGPATR